MRKRKPVQSSLLPDDPTIRVSLSLPASLAGGVKSVAKQLRMSQSALVTGLLSDAIPHLLSNLDDVQDLPTDQAVRRFRGASIDHVLTSLGSLMKDS